MRCRQQQGLSKEEKHPRIKNKILQTTNEKAGIKTQTDIILPLLSGHFQKLSGAHLRSFVHVWMWSQLPLSLSPSDLV